MATVSYLQDQPGILRETTFRTKSILRKITMKTQQLKSYMMQPELFQEGHF